MAESMPSLWESMKARGYSRRDFLRFCSSAAAVAGVGASGLGDVVRALEKKPRPPVVWLHFQECTCCSESFIRSSHPVVADIVLDLLSLDYTETLQAAAGFQAEWAREDCSQGQPDQTRLDRARAFARDIMKTFHGSGKSCQHSQIPT